MRYCSILSHWHISLTASCTCNQLLLSIAAWMIEQKFHNESVHGWVFPASRQSVALVLTWINRSPSNLRQITRECVYLVRRGHFPLRDKDGGHTIRSATVDPCCMHILHSFGFYRTRLIAHHSFICGNREFHALLLLWHWPWPDDLHIRTWPLSPKDVRCLQTKMSFVHQRFRIESYRTYYIQIYEGRSINKLQNGIILLIFKI